ncbi:MAG: hypothetical protein MUE85_09895 [Microscillaceae bacterium]|nr:hypothetical protein [Microscillaceae bacterium]
MNFCVILPKILKEFGQFQVIKYLIIRQRRTSFARDGHSQMNNTIYPTLFSRKNARAQSTDRVRLWELGINN